MTDENVRHMWSEDDLDQALATLNADVPPGGTALAKARSELMAAAGAPAGKAKRHWGRWVAAGVTVAALVATAFVVQTVGDTPASSAAADVLNGAADKIGAKDPAVGPGQYLYVETHSHYRNSVIADEDRTVIFTSEELAQEWVPADRSQEWLLRRTKGESQLVSGDPQIFGRINGEPGFPDAMARCGDFYLNKGEQPCNRPGSWQKPNQRFLADLPTDPKKLYERLRADTADRGQDPDLEMVVYVADAISSGLVPADVRANLYRALALMPSLVISDQHANLAGRLGTALGVDRAGTKQELIIDPETGQFIGERETATKGFKDTPAGTVTGFSSVTTGVADKIGDKPAK